MDQPVPQFTHAPDLTQIAAAALLIGGFSALVSLSAAAALLIVSPQLRPYWPIILIGAPLMIGAGAAGVTGIHWIKTGAAAQWTSYAYDVDASADADDPLPLDLQRAVMDAGYRILILHYIHGSPATRPDCEQVGIPQDDWNRVNTILQALGIKTARSWSSIDPAAAFDLWSHLQWIGAQSVMLPSGNGSYRRLDL